VKAYVMIISLTFNRTISFVTHFNFQYNISLFYHRQSVDAVFDCGQISDIGAPVA
jgi:hypothetical protein